MDLSGALPATALLLLRVLRVAPAPPRRTLPATIAVDLLAAPCRAAALVFLAVPYRAAPVDR